MKACFATSGATGMSYVVRTVLADAVAVDDFVATTDQLNALVSVRKPGQLLEAVDGLPPILPVAGTSEFPRSLSMEEARRKLPSFFPEAGTAPAAGEFFLDSATPLRANESASTPKLQGCYRSGTDIVAELVAEDMVARDFGEDAPDLAILVEPVQDWITIRAALSVCLRLNPVARGEGTMEEAGFMRITDPSSRKEYYSIPFKYDTAFAKPKPNLKSLGAVLGNNQGDPLFEAMTISKKGSANFPLEHRVPSPGSDAVAFVPLSGPNKASRLFSRMLGDDRQRPVLHTVTLVTLAGDTDQESALQVIEAMSSSMRSLSLKGASGAECRCGWEYFLQGEIDGAAYPLFKKKSFASALWYSLSYRGDKKVAVCKLCKNAILSNERGNKKEYCSNSCRVRDAKRRRARELDG